MIRESVRQSGSYVDGAGLLQDARLRLDKLGKRFGILIVEGDEEVRLLADFMNDRSQIIPAGGKNVLDHAFQSRRRRDEDSIVFLRDCDYDVAAGSVIAGQRGLILTRYADVEADLFDLGLLRQAVVQLLPISLDPDSAASEIMKRALSLAEPIGRARCAARVRGLKIDCNLSFKKHRPKDGTAKSTAVLGAIHRQSTGTRTISLAQFTSAVTAQPTGLQVCRGHDLVDAVQDVLVRDFGVSATRARLLPALLRTALTQAGLGSWTSAQRILAWQRTQGLALFK